jgi:hypothetical protein
MIMPKRRIHRKLRQNRDAKPTIPPSRLAELAEAQEILLPELAARIAALEHLLIERGVCTREELKQARVFIDTRQSS